LAIELTISQAGASIAGMLIPRTAAETLTALAQGYPVVVVTGPRQSGKTTLCRATFPDLPYVSLEDPDLRRFAL
jgi:predicted AAA+ superfamily ATPase